MPESALRKPLPSQTTAPPSLLLWKLTGTGSDGLDSVQHQQDARILKIGNAKNQLGMSLFVPMEIYSVQSRFLVGTGAVVTVLSSRVYQAMPEASRPPLRQPTVPLKLEVANNELLEIDGVMDAKFDIDGQDFEHKMYVAPIAEELLGMDFLCANDYELGARYGLKLNGQQICTEDQDLAIHVARVTL